jgi:tryptophan-rich sensory protein
MPSNDTLIGDPNFRTPMSIFGIIFIALIIISILAAYVVKRRD